MTNNNDFFILAYVLILRLKFTKNFSKTLGNQNTFLQRKIKDSGSKYFFLVTFIVNIFIESSMFWHPINNARLRVLTRVIFQRHEKLESAK